MSRTRIAFFTRIALLVAFLSFTHAAWSIEAVAVKAKTPKTAPTKISEKSASTLTWHDARSLTIEGQGWTETQSDYDRLPARAKEKVRAAVWNLSRHSAGIAVKFITDATTIHARWSLISKRLAMPHMAATGVSGLDLYVRHTDGQWRWLACAQPTEQTNNVKVISGLPAGERSYLMYLPLYNGVSNLEIGIPNENQLAAAPARPRTLQKPIVFYGTSITHGACASRPGMVHTAMLGRQFDRPVINLGFSGNGEMEAEVTELIAELDAALFVIDCLPNLNASEVQARAIPCVEILRKAHPQTPILLVEDRSYSDSYLVHSKREHNLNNRQALKKAYQKLQAAGDQHLYYLEGEHLLGDDNDGTVDSSHPNDLGFRRQADAMAKVIEPLLTNEVERHFKQ